MDWQRLSTHEHARRRFTAALLPIGTVEAHDGAPLGTDNYIPEALCRRLADELDMPWLPPMPYGVTRSLLAYPGSCGVSAACLEGFLVELGASLRRNGLRYLFVIDGHGGNLEALQAGAARLFEAHGLYTAVIEWWFEAQALAEEIFGAEGLGHAAVDELGLLAGLRPDLAADFPRGPVPSYAVLKGVKAYPAPRPVLTYDQAGETVDLARLAPESCERFAEGVLRIVSRAIREILSGWQALDRERDGR
ncbi:MAG: creatininase family protein [Candidatus Eisenbacteria bacterium]|uniref:Creatininase family protein n=1 Tax=Eiseniibacteriota bacterium TaxID=2212470 RepID=A0A938BQW2_UNCEI|nr:creatininase family protein [Candidatus Eisenbacteria bacterium]